MEQLGFVRPEAHVDGVLFGKGYIKSQGNTTPADYNNSSADHATYVFNLHGGGYFTVYFRVNTNGNASQDSLFLRVDSNSWQTINNTSGLGSGWHWVASPYTFPLGPGDHTLEIANRETGIEIDKIAIQYDTDPAPTGTGQPAFNCTTPLYFEAECPNTAFGAYPFLRYTKSGYSGSGYLYSKANTTVGASSSVDQATYKFWSATATYAFHFRVDSNGSADDDSWFYRVDNGSWTTMNNISNATGWRWVQGTTQVNLTVGQHTLEIRNRENGLQIDKIAILDSAAQSPTGSGGAGMNCGPATNMTEWDWWDALDYANTHANYFAANGSMVLDMHEMWHIANDPGGGERGPGSGTAFLGMHRAMVNAFRAYALSVGGRSYIPINVNGALPPNLYDAYAALSVSGMNASGTPYLDHYGPRLTTDLTGVSVPPYLTATGGPAVPAGPGHNGWSSTYQLEGTGPFYAKLSDIPDLDTLGRIIGTSQYHRSVHSAIEGTMGTYFSPADGAFYGWHGWIDAIVDNWLKTTTGQNWAAANPSHPFLDVGFSEMDGWDYVDWQ